jgi:hypothetical protein
MLYSEKNDALIKTSCLHTFKINITCFSLQKCGNLLFTNLLFNNLLQLFVNWKFKSFYMSVVINRANESEKQNESASKLISHSLSFSF